MNDSKKFEVKIWYHWSLELLELKDQPLSKDWAKCKSNIDIRAIFAVGHLANFDWFYLAIICSERRYR